MTREDPAAHPHPVPPLPPVHELVARRAARSPHAPAVAAGGRVLTYRQLDRAADRLARTLRALGAGPGRIVGVCLPRGPQYATALLAVLKSGAAYLPLDPAQPAGRLDGLAAAAGARIVLAAPGGPAPAAEHVLPCPPDPEPGGGPAPAPDAPRPAASRPDDLAYVVFTSGSTGEPKGVMVEHGSLANLVAWDTRTAALTPSDRCTLIASPAFDASVWELWPALAAGACLHVPPPETVLAPDALRAWMVRTGVTVSFLPTRLAEPLIAAPWPDGTALRLLRTGGDRLRGRPRPDQPFLLVNNYGPTEATVVALAGPVPAGDDTGAPALGVPVAGAVALVVDDGLRPVGPGTTGELCLGGPGLARGYLGRPDLTAERFVTRPGPGGGPLRLYRTGDLVRLGPDGTYEFHGRADDQIALDGHRIEPEEVVSALLALPEVAAAHVGLHNGRVAGWLVPSGPPGTVAPAAVAARLAERLPGYMVPRQWAVLERLPVSFGGKVDRAALPAPASSASAPHRAPRAGAEQTVAAVWREVLGLEEIGADDGFFDLGGHSMLLETVHLRLQDLTGRTFPLIALFEHPTLAALAAFLERGQDAAPAAPPLSAAAAERRRGGVSRLRRGRSRTGTPAAGPAADLDGGTR
ncbi:non-ribosomal peptide synthetase [Streptomyces sp. NBC_01477]|uniref:non-ribosomal peptide synthetase n=1 Tax=Streptomyces sp. NBC_01477 TaxID=2976015 RepID=UPI002E307497|nr:non-ribosomal peptide synthetase [Streptomyces sp. NBC_01477]